MIYLTNLRNNVVALRSNFEQSFSFSHLLLKFSWIHSKFNRFHSKIIDLEQVFWKWKHFMNFEKILRNFMNFHAQNSLIRLALHFFAYQVVTCNKIIQTNWTVWKWIEPCKIVSFPGILKVKSMLMTFVGDRMCWWEVWGVCHTIQATNDKR